MVELQYVSAHAHQERILKNLLSFNKPKLVPPSIFYSCYRGSRNVHKQQNLFEVGKIDF
jgi:hypothetical protein